MLKKFNEFFEEWKKMIFATYIFCPFCKSVNVIFSNHRKYHRDIDGDKLYETYDLKCNNCGAKGTGNENWDRD